MDGLTQIARHFHADLPGNPNGSDPDIWFERWHTRLPKDIQESFTTATQGLCGFTTACGQPLAEVRAWTSDATDATCATCLAALNRSTDP